MTDLNLEQMLEEARIQRVLVRYAQALDERDWAALDQVFTDDARVRYESIGEFNGRARIVDVVRDALAPCGRTQHLIGNIWVEFTGPETATAVSYVRAWHRWPETEQKPDMTLWGEYHDVWVLLDGTWRIRERRVLEAGIEPRRGGGAKNRRRAKA